MNNHNLDDVQEFNNYDQEETWEQKYYTLCAKYNLLRDRLQLADCSGCLTEFSQQDLKRCECGLTYCKKCSKSINWRAKSHHIHCCECGESVCVKCSAEPCSHCTNFTCLRGKLYQNRIKLICVAYSCSVLNCSNLICRTCSDDSILETSIITDNAKCQLCKKLFCDDCMFGDIHNCRPMIATCGHVAYLGNIRFSKIIPIGFNNPSHCTGCEQLCCSRTDCKVQLAIHNAKHDIIKLYLIGKYVDDDCNPIYTLPNEIMVHIYNIFVALYNRDYVPPKIVKDLVYELQDGIPYEI
jgi:hypothetical protein